MFPISSWNWELGSEKRAILNFAELAGRIGIDV